MRPSQPPPYPPPLAGEGREGVLCCPPALWLSTWFVTRFTITGRIFMTARAFFD
jgi:hypothetical protein